MESSQSISRISKLERITHICLITLTLVSLALLIERRFPLRSNPPNAQQLVGRHLAITGLHWESTPLHAVLYMSTHCRYCAASMPFYRRMVIERDTASSKVALSVLSIEPAGEMKNLLSREQIQMDGVYLAPSTTGLAATPTLLLIDSKGTVKRVFQGQLDSRGQQEVLEIVKTGVLGKG